MDIVKQVENAIRYSPEQGHVRIRSASTDRKLTVAVFNSVTALSQLTQDYLLRFEQLDSEKLVSRPPHMGFGLAIVAKILRLHDSASQVTMLTDEEVGFSFELAVYQPDGKDSKK